MVTLLSTAIFIIGFLAVALYFWQKPARRAETQALPARPDQLRGLFSETEASKSTESPAVDREAERASLIARANDGDKTSLNEALRRPDGRSDQPLYQELLRLLLSRITADSDYGSSLLSLVSYVTRHEFHVRRELADAILQSWKTP